MGRKIEIELTDDLEHTADAIFKQGAGRSNEVVGFALGQAVPFTGWADEASFWRDVIIQGLDVIAALQHGALDEGEDYKPEDNDGIPF